MITYHSFDGTGPYMDDAKYWIHACTDNRVVGTISLCKCNGWAWVSDLKVHPTFRRKGIGRTLITRITEEHPNLLAELPLGAGVYKANQPSLDTFKSLGWVIGEEYNEGKVFLLTPPTILI
jgi:GNAT superfamily N-acetyltransferase